MTACRLWSGLLTGDNLFSNANVTRQLNFCVRGSNANTDTTVFGLEETNDAEGTYTITPTSRKTIVYFTTGTLLNNTSITFIMNNQNVTLGDEMTWLIDASDHQLTINVPFSQYSMTGCGDPLNVFLSTDFTSDQLVLRFIYDGQIWINSWDNC